MIEGLRSTSYAHKRIMGFEQGGSVVRLLSIMWLCTCLISCGDAATGGDPMPDSSEETSRSEADVQGASDALASTDGADEEGEDSPGPGEVEEPSHDLPSGALSEVLPGGETLCARGTPFRFFVYPADPQRSSSTFKGRGLLE